MRMSSYASLRGSTVKPSLLVVPRAPSRLKRGVISRRVPMIKTAAIDPEVATQFQELVSSVDELNKELERFQLSSTFIMVVIGPAVASVVGLITA